MKLDTSYKFLVGIGWKYQSSRSIASSSHLNTLSPVINWIHVAISWSHTAGYTVVIIKVRVTYMSIRLEQFVDVEMWSQSKP